MNMSENFQNIDTESLSEKYRLEREKRLRTDGWSQYRSGDEESLQHYADDPYVKESDRRTSKVNEDTTVLIIGGGFGGLLAAVKLMTSGIQDFMIVEKAGDFGGTWYWNRYPGVMCDIDSYCYFPLLEEMKYIPSEKYAHGPEIFEYAKAIGRKFGLYFRTTFQAEVTSVKWKDGSNHWDVKTKQGDYISAKFVVVPGGLLHKPKFPGVDGLETFKGHSFHTGRWDYDYTGGDPSSPMTNLSDKVVGLIGTGASAIQIVPELARSAKHLYVFQRTPSAVDSRGNRPTDKGWAESLDKGWQARRINNFETIVGGGYQETDLVGDGWTDISRQIPTWGTTDPEELGRLLQLADYEKQSQIRDRVDKIVKDPVVAEKLKAWYNRMCKRPCFHDEYLQAFNRENVTLVDTNGKGVDSINETSVVANGTDYKVDCIVYSTGFYLTSDFANKNNLQTIGRNGLSVGEKWSQGSQTLHSIMTHDFPNCFFMRTIQAGVSANFVLTLNEQATHMAYMIKQCLENEWTTIEPSVEAELAYTAKIEERGRRMQPFAKTCTPGTWTNEGQKLNLKNGTWSFGGHEWGRMLKAWRDEGSMEGIEAQTGRRGPAEPEREEDFPVYCEHCDLAQLHSHQDHADKHHHHE